MMDFVLRLWFPILLLFAWQVAAAAGWLDPLFFPSPAHLVVTFAEMSGSGMLWTHTSATLLRLVCAFLVGATSGSVVGLILGASPFWRRSLEPVLHGLYATPKVALLPAFLLILGVNETSRVLPAVLNCFVLLATSAVDAARSVRPGYLELASAYGANRRQLFLRVFLPYCLPSLFTGLRLGLGSSLILVVASEMVGASHGLGSLIWISGQTFAIDRLFVGVLVCAATGAFAGHALHWLEVAATPWVPRRRTLSPLVPPRSIEG